MSGAHRVSTSMLDQAAEAFSDHPYRGELACWLIERFADCVPSDMPWLPWGRRWAALAALRAAELLLGLPADGMWSLHAELRLERTS